jgi:hypothetical protein
MNEDIPLKRGGREGCSMFKVRSSKLKDQGIVDTEEKNVQNSKFKVQGLKRQI